MSINRTTISGNLTRDPELRRTQSGMAVMSLSVAVNERRKDPQTGEWGDYANFVDCTLFGKRAESLANYLSKGSKVAVEGKLRQDRWTDRQTGQNRSKLQVVIDEIDLMSQRQQGGQQGGGYDNPPAEVYGEDIPF